MTYLDVSPMIQSLRTMPEDFDMRDDWLRHSPSRHSFKFEPSGEVVIRAGCSCAFLMIHPEQERALGDAFQDWRRSYWEPLEINRQFAAHFKAGSPVRRFLIRAVAALQRWLSGQHDDAFYPAATLAE